MLRTPACDLLGVEVPIMQAAIWPATSPELVVAVCEAGGLGSMGWKRASLRTESEDVARFEAWEGVFPPAGGGAYATVPRVMRTPFVEEWLGRTEEARREAERLREEVRSAIQGRTTHGLLPFTGQTAGLVHDILPAKEIAGW